KLERRRRLELMLLASACVAVTVLGFIRHVLGGGLPHARYLFPTYWVAGLAVAVALRALGNRITGLVCGLLATASVLHLVIRLDGIVTRSSPGSEDDSIIGRWRTTLDQLGAGSLTVVAVCGLAVLAFSALLLRDVVDLGRPAPDPAP
ncbi:MAG: hypothetical protein OSA99_14080, partial [Acidimicrobiales bacterium]|nr:hypothetical protein [Acidimicrobiales bacterium]